jgi:hypothetical protein
MFARATSLEETPIPLSIAAGQRIVMPGLDPVMGWIGEETTRAAQPLIFPPWLLEPRPTETITYACNLPAPAPHGQTERAPAAFATEAEFLAASLPGGRAAIVAAGGKPGAMLFRWLCVTANASRGTVWRCFAKLCLPQTAPAWSEVGKDYAFEAAGGFPFNVPGNVRVQAQGSSFKIAFPEGKLTCFPAQSGLVKVTQIEADGWARRELAGVWLYPGRSIVARFSDGRAMRIATAAPARTAFMAA